MKPRVDLILLGGSANAGHWPNGAVMRSAAAPRALHDLLASRAQNDGLDAVLVWDAALGELPASRVLELLALPGDIFHAGLALGMAGAPRLLDHVAPTWTFNRDPDASHLATSWRISFRACLVRSTVLRWAMPNAEFASLHGMALEWGHRCIRHGALPRHDPALLRSTPGAAPTTLPLEDEFRFLRAAFGSRWTAWAAARAAMVGDAPFEALADTWLATAGQRIATPAAPYRAPERARAAIAPAVTVLIPTLERYPHLRTVLGQLRGQTVAPLEIIVVDQTPPAHRDAALERDFADLPLTLIQLDAAGQSSARNAGLLRARGDAILFIDDDDEIEPDLIARHLEHLDSTGAEVSSGVAQEPTSGPLPDAFTRPRASDVFPTNNTLARRAALERSGLFDLAYDHGARADGDLGMRVYLSGAVMMLSPRISVLHHHAPRGGLRVHGARVVTYARSRRAVTARQLPEVTDLYRVLRYFSPRQLQAMLSQAAVGTLSAHGGRVQRVLKAAFGALAMPDTLWQLRRRLAAAHAMLERPPRIPLLPPRDQ